MERIHLTLDTEKNDDLQEQLDEALSRIEILEDRRVFLIHPTGCMESVCRGWKETWEYLSLCFENGGQEVPLAERPLLAILEEAGSYTLRDEEYDMDYHIQLEG